MLGSGDGDSPSLENPGAKFCSTVNLILLKVYLTSTFVLFLGHLDLPFTFVCSFRPVPRYMQVNGLDQPGLLPHPPGDLCHWSAVPSEGGWFAITPDVYSGNRDNHPATGVSDIYTDTVLDDKTEGLLYKKATPTRRRVKKNQIIIILEEEVTTGAKCCQVFCLFIQ